MAMTSYLSSRFLVNPASVKVLSPTIFGGALLYYLRNFLKPKPFRMHCSIASISSAVAFPVTKVRFPEALFSLIRSNRSKLTV